ncbi:MAG: response regulator [candidate division WOR-3 bacterium]
MKGSKKRILFVEDEAPLAFFVSQILGSDYEVESVRTGEEAIKKWKEKPYDLLVTDVRLPGMSGLELIANLQKDYPDIKFIIVTAYDSYELREKVKEFKGMKGFFPKPFSIEEIKKEINKIFQE